MSSVESHPSFLALDRAALGVRDRDVTAHLATCARCRAHLERRAAAPPLPPALRALDAPPWWRRAWALVAPRPVAYAGFAGALAVAALVVALPGDRGTIPAAPDEPAYVAAKGLAAVAIWVKHGDEVRLWDGVGAVAPGDRVQLELEPGPHRWFALLGGDAEVPLAEGTLEPERRFLLPRAFVLDEVPGDETLVVILAPAPLDEEELAAAAAGDVPEAKAIRLVIPKETGPGARR